MRTSNKILLGLIVIVFTVPLLLAASLKAKVKKGEYTVEKFENAKDEKLVAGSFKPFKVVKVVAPKTDLLTCYLKTSGKMDYSYYKKGGKDSINVVTVNDTLLIQYIPFSKVDPKSQNQDWDRMLELNVSLPAFNSLVVDGAVVIVDSFPANPNNISVMLKNRGELKEGRSREDEAAGEIKVSRSDIKDNMQKVPEAKVVAATEQGATNMFNASKSDVSDLNFKELLVYHLLYKI